MKKLLYSILALAGVAFTSCTQEHIDVQYIPGNVVAPVLGNIEGCELSEDGADITVEFTKADFGVATSTAHNLYVAKSEDMADMKKAKATFGEGVITMTQADLNVVALDFGEAGAEVTLYFAVVANLNTDKGSVVAGSESMSNVVAATFKSYVADVLPSEKFDKVWVIGNYCGWAHDKTQFLFDYTSSGSTYSGVIDFAGADGVSLANTGFKLTGIAGWDDTCNWGEETKATEADEPASIQLITGGGSQDIMRYAKRFYGFEFDKTTLVLKKQWGADQIGVIGLNGDWDNDIVMEYNPKWTRFYVDIDAAAATEMKFRADAAWDLNWGVDCAQGGGNIPVEAGKYRVYFNPSTGLIEFNAKAYGTAEDTGATGGDEPVAPVEKVYGLVGTPNNWGESADTTLADHNGDWLAAKGYALTAADQFKVRVNSDWAENFGAAGDVEPFVVNNGEKYTLVAGGKNMSVAADGSYDIYFNKASAELYVVEAGAADPTLPSDAKAVKLYAHKEGNGWAEMALYGWDGYDFGGWPGILLTEKETIDGKEFFVFEFPATAYGITTNIIFNNNNNGEQTQDITGVVLNRDYYYIIPAEAEGGKFMAYEMGTEPVKPAVPVLGEHTWGVIGDHNGWGADDAMTAEGDWVVAKGVSFTAGQGFKVRADAGWNINYGNAEAGQNAVLDTEFEVFAGGQNVMIEKDGTYDIYFTIAGDVAKMKVVAQ